MLFRHPLFRLSYSGMVGKQGVEPRLPDPKSGALPLRYIPLTRFCFLVALTVLAGDPPLGYPTNSADRPERDPHPVVKEVLFLGDGGGDLGLEFHQAPEPAQGVACLCAYRAGRSGPAT